MGGLYKKVPTTVSADFTLGNDVNLVTLPEFSPGIDNTGIILTLPYAGVYNIYFQMALSHSSGLTFDNRWVVGYLYDDDAEAYIPGAKGYLLTMNNLASNGDFWVDTGTIVVGYTVNSPRVIRLLTARHSISDNCAITHDFSHFGYTVTY